MSWIPAPTEPVAADTATPVTVWLTPAQAARLEVVLAHHRDHGGLDDDAVCDAVFETGLRAAEMELTHG